MIRLSGMNKMESNDKMVAIANENQNLELFKNQGLQNQEFKIKHNYRFLAAEHLENLNHFSVSQGDPGYIFSK